MRVGSPVIIIHLIVMQCVKEKVEGRERGSREGEGEGEGVWTGEERQTTRQDFPGMPE